MNEQQKRLPYSYEVGVVAAWREQLAEAAENPWLASVLLKYGERILRRFVYFYQQLRGLSRRARRHIQRKLALSLGAAALLLALSSIQVPLAYGNSINVAASEVAINDNGVCSLIEAIENANDTVTGQPHDDCAAGDPAGADTINLPAGSTFTLDSVHSGKNGLPVITSQITIEGNGATIQRDGAAPQFRILEVDGSGANNGDLTLKKATISAGDVSGSGGGVHNYRGTVSVESSTISGNTASDDGGGVSNFLYGMVTIENSTISGNSVSSSSYGGGGVSNFLYGMVTIENSTISGNSASSFYGGAGVCNFGGMVSIENSTISGNSASHGGGGGVSNLLYGTVSIENSTISGNTTSRDGGGVATYNGETTINNSTISGNTASYYGGGVYNYEGTVSIGNSTISGNSAYWGGGVDNYEGTVSIENSTISGNSAYYGGGVCNYAEAGAATVTIGHSIVSGNTATADGNEVWNKDTVNANDYNLFGYDDNDGLFGCLALPGATDIAPAAGVQVADILDALADNGGPTETHALVPGSPAIDAGDPAFTPPPTFDQRGPGFPRVVNGVIDIGAYEVQLPPVPIGGIAVPVDKVGLLAPWMGLAGLVATAVAAVAARLRRSIQSQ